MTAADPALWPLPEQGGILFSISFEPDGDW